MKMTDEQRILKQAAEWFARLNDQQVSEDDRLHWQAWIAADKDHARVWQRVEAISQPFKQATAAVPADAARATLNELNAMSRRRMLHLLGVTGAAVSAGLLLRHLLPWQRWSYDYAVAHADYRTGIGERKPLRLPEGTQLTLNTATAVDVKYEQDIRRIVLHQGEILVTSAHDVQTPARPLVVDTRHARLTALGTRFTVRGDEHGGHLAVFEGAVRVAPFEAASQDVVAGQQVRFTADAVIADGRADLSREAWARGQMIADNMPLADFVAELSRYSTVPLAIKPDVAHLRLVGVYPMSRPERDIPQILATLETVLPVHIQKVPSGALIITSR